MTKEAIEEKAFALAKEAADSLGYILVDTEYVKEGGQYYLRTYIDKEGGITVDDCEAMSDMLNPMLDAADFISAAYVMEVSSPGLGREIRRPHDFEYALGREVDVKTYRAVEGKKAHTGVLDAFDEEKIVLDEDGTQVAIPRKDTAKISLAFTL